MTFKEAQEKMANEYRFENRHYHDSDGVDVAEVFKEGSDWGARYILEHEAVKNLYEALVESQVELKKYEVLSTDKFGGYTKMKIEKNSKALAAFKELERQVSEK